MRRTAINLTGLLIAASCAGTAMAAEEAHYGDLGNWRIVANGQGGSFVYCAAETDNGQVAVRLATDGRDWGIGVPYYGQGQVQGGIGFSGIEGWVDFDAGDDGWAAARIQPQGLVELRRQHSLYIELDRGIQRYSLEGSSAALDKALECVADRGIAKAPKVAEAPASGSDNDTGKLPGTGLTPEQAASLIGVKPTGSFGSSGDLYAKCDWAINETPFPTLDGPGYLLYYAASCKGRVSKLEYAGGAHYSELTVADSAFAAYSEEPFAPPDYPLVRITDPGEGDVRANLLARVRAEMEDPAMEPKCGILPTDYTGLPEDHIVIGLMPEHLNDKPEYSEPYGAVGLCGPFGENDGVSFWRVFQGNAWFFDLGQDAWHDIAPESLTLVTPDGKGGWKRVE